MTIDAWLDETPGETRGIVARAGRHERLIIHRASDAPAGRLGALSVGRVASLEPGLNGVFVETAGAAAGFLPLKGGARLTQGQAIEVEVTAEARGGKGPTLKLVGPAEGEPRLTAEAPSARDWLARWAPGVTPGEGAEAIQAGLEAEEDALGAGVSLPDAGLDIAVERTRALVAVDVDHQGGGVRAKAGANRRALSEAARLIRLKAWGGLVVIDLVGSSHDGAKLAEAARQAFRDAAEPALGPISRFGLLQLSIPWSRTPVEEILRDRDGRETLETRALAIVRALRRALLTDTAAPRWTAVAHPEEAEMARAWVAQLGPRAHLVADPAMRPGAFRLDHA